MANSVDSRAFFSCTSTSQKTNLVALTKCLVRYDPLECNNLVKIIKILFELMRFLVNRNLQLFERDRNLVDLNRFLVTLAKFLVRSCISLDIQSFICA